MRCNAQPVSSLRCNVGFLSSFLGLVDGVSISRRNTLEVNASFLPPTGYMLYSCPLQECNISPDNLITPAMVIKNKEEREARQRTEAVNAASVVAAASASFTAAGNVVASTSSTVTVMATPTAAVVSTAAVVVGHPSTVSTAAAARGMHHPQQQHPTIVTISGTGSASGSTSGTGTGAAIPRSANILVSFSSVWRIANA